MPRVNLPLGVGMEISSLICWPMTWQMMVRSRFVAISAAARSKMSSDAMMSGGVVYGRLDEKIIVHEHHEVRSCANVVGNT